MNYTELNIGEETYKLRLTTRNLVSLEKALGCNPMQIFYDLDNGTLPKLSDIALILQASLQSYQHGIDMNKTYDIIDAYIANEHQMFDLVPVLIEVFQDSGFVSKDEASEENSPN